MHYDPQSGPYLIGLTGAMATGKSSVMARLVKLGAYPIDCDKVRQLILYKILILAGQSTHLLLFPLLHC